MPHKKGRFSAPGSEQSIPLHVQNLDAKADLLTESYPTVLTDTVKSDDVFFSSARRGAGKAQRCFTRISMDKSNVFDWCRDCERGI